MSEGKIYKIQNKVNSKVYVGSTKNIQKRWNNHKSELRNNKHSNAHLQSSFNKYGIDNFKFSVIEEVDETSGLIQREQHYMDILEPEYNIIPRADRSKLSKETKKKIGKANKNPSEETRQKMSRSHKGHEVSGKVKRKLSEINKGKKLSEEHKKKIGEAHKGKKLSAETKKKVSESRKGREHSRETRQKMSESHKGKKVSRETRDKLREINKGKEMSEEAKQKMSESTKGENHPNYGKELSEETKRKISKANRGDEGSNSKLTEKKVKTIKHLLNGGHFTHKEISKMYGVSKGTIRSISIGRVWGYVKI